MGDESRKRVARLLSQLSPSPCGSVRLSDEEVQKVRWARPAEEEDEDEWSSEDDDDELQLRTVERFPPTPRRRPAKQRPPPPPPVVPQHVPDPMLDDVDEGREATKWNGWGFADTELVLNREQEVELTGSRYGPIFTGGARVLPKFAEWARENLGLDLSRPTTLPVAPPDLGSYPAPRLNEAFLAAVRASCGGERGMEVRLDGPSRLRRSHGHTLEEVMAMRQLGQPGVEWPRLPDAVLLPRSHEHVVALVNAAKGHGVCVIPYGGGTSVTMGLACPANEERMVVSVDMRRMRRIRWIDRDSMVACVEAGIIGSDLEDRLKRVGLTMGHEPDSIEHSTLGGWIATRASGMKKNVYGNIEDIVLNTRLVTPAGVLHRGNVAQSAGAPPPGAGKVGGEVSYARAHWPRVSTGPDVLSLALGSEGTFGIVTDAIVRLRRLPAASRYGSVVFPDWECGVNALREIADKGVAPASIRLVDNMQFRFAQAMKPADDPSVPEWRRELINQATTYYITRYHGLDPETLTAATLLFEGGSDAAIDAQQRAVMAICKRHGGVAGDAKNGVRGYFMTFMIAYLRDLALRHGFVSESFETSVPWREVLPLVDAVKARLRSELRRHKVQGIPFITSRISQTYDSGACVYFYFGMQTEGLAEPVQTYLAIETAAREEILARGGSLSHHHGVGKLRKRWIEQTSSPAAIALLRSTKLTLDPTNVFGSGNLL